MDWNDTLTSLFTQSRSQSALSWLGTGVLIGIIGRSLQVGSYQEAILGTMALLVIVGPAIRFRDPTTIPPWYYIGLVILPPLVGTTLPVPGPAGLIPAIGMATIALLVTVELHRFTSLRLVPWFAVTVTVLTTLAFGGLLNIIRWTLDVVFGTEFLLDERSVDAINDAVMIELLFLTIAGILAGGFFYLDFRRRRGVHHPKMAVPPTSPTPVQTSEAVLSDRLGVAARRQRQAVRLMQFILVGLLLYGLVSFQIAVIVNAGLSLAITFIPAILEHDFEIPIEPGLALWVTAAVFLHALGTAGFYDWIGPWDHLTHTLSATVVAAAGYALLRAIHLHSPDINLPPWALFGFTLIFVIAMGVVWELFEFAADTFAEWADLEPVLAQHGIHDTIVDMLFNLVGAVLVAGWGTVYVVSVSDALVEYLQEFTDEASTE